MSSEFSQMVVAGVLESMKTLLMWGVIVGVTVAGIGFYVYTWGRDQVNSPAHQFVVACRAVGGTPFSSADASLSCFSAPGAGKDFK